MNLKLIQQAETFLLETFDASPYLQNCPSERNYRLEHSYRVANLAKNIAAQEGLDVTDAVLAGLLHDIAYCEEMHTQDDRKNHGRRSAAIARSFLEQADLPHSRIQNICLSIAIHVDDQADFDWPRTTFSEIVGDADNLDRFDAYRIYETLEYQTFSELSLAEKQQTIGKTLTRLHQLLDMKLSTPTAQSLWTQRLNFYLTFYEKLQNQLQRSNCIL